MISLDVSAIDFVAILDINDETLGLGILSELLSDADKGIRLEGLPQSVLFIGGRESQTAVHKN